MIHSKHATLLALFIITAVLIGGAYVTDSAVAFVGALVSLTLLFLSPFLFSVSSGEVEQRDAAREIELEKIKQFAVQQKESGKLLIRRDLELTRANEQLRALDQMKTDFVTIATHQLRTPLTAIRWILSMLLRGDMGPLSDEQKTYIMKTYESNNRMVALLSAMLISDKISSEKLRATEETAMLPDLADNLITEIGQLAEKKGVRLVFGERKDTYPRARIDPQNMRAILQNLLENGIKYTPSGGDVTLTIREQGSNLVFAVSDSGIGIPADQQKNIFKRFFRAQNALRMETDGSGLGLFIVKGIVEKFKGEVSFESREGKGTTFRVVLPEAVTH
ncbi:hypothetical protein A2765_04065 [Candidatus Kaiserbacteria bacterium RIFCSPHIGHO2_01_FULL_56_24]|uniref:histidine kinase n=1 Tax=Candidatus Kaiserbacteria bacterium RIFCSPHIGHO2_01_FULL_56_24 TaxID=1798487 RepID=A0A1F6DED9_9BACT|nr:MAG: hypothetical protein A2765_04065 [Candidatus Kaiserbacteria bacterium RIFCSPHIGHO2_01_FULL_56_24]